MCSSHGPACTTRLANGEWLLQAAHRPTAVDSHRALVCSRVRMQVRAFWFTPAPGGFSSRLLACMGVLRKDTCLYTLLYNHEGCVLLCFLVRLDEWGKYTHTHVNTHSLARTHALSLPHTCIYIIDIYIYTYMYVHIYMHYVHIHMHIDISIHMYTYVDTFSRDRFSYDA